MNLPAFLLMLTPHAGCTEDLPAPPTAGKDQVYSGRLPQDAELEERVTVTEGNSALYATFPASTEENPEVEIDGTLEIEYLGSTWVVEDTSPEEIEDFFQEGNHFGGTWSIAGVTIEFEGTFFRRRHQAELVIYGLGTILLTDTEYIKPPREEPNDSGL